MDRLVPPGQPVNRDQQVLQEHLEVQAKPDQQERLGFQVKSARLEVQVQAGYSARPAHQAPPAQQDKQDLPAAVEVQAALVPLDLQDRQV